MTETLMLLGAVTAVCAGWAVVLLAIFLLALSTNRLCHYVLDCYGGWKTFLKFRKWYAENEGKEQP